MLREISERTDVNSRVWERIVEDRNGRRRLVERAGNWSGGQDGVRKPGKPALKCIDILKRDTGEGKDGIKATLQDRQMWRVIVIRLTRLKQEVCNK